MASAGEPVSGQRQWPWADGGAWVADVRAALRVWLQEHKRELGFLGQRQLEQAAAGCSCSEYVATQRPAAAGYVIFPDPWLVCAYAQHVKCPLNPCRVAARRWDIHAELKMPCAGSKVKDSFLSLAMSCCVAMDAHVTTAASFQIREGLGTGPGARADTGGDAAAQLVCFEAGQGKSGDAEGGGAGAGQEDASTGSRLQGRERSVTGGMEGTAGISEIRILIDSAGMIRVRDLLLPALDEIADMVDLVCSLPLLRCCPCLPPLARHTRASTQPRHKPVTRRLGVSSDWDACWHAAACTLCTSPPCLAGTVRTMAIEEIVEELCWDEEEGDEDDEDDDGESGEALAAHQLPDQPREAEAETECHARQPAAAAADTLAAGVGAAAGQVTGGGLSRKDKRAAKKRRSANASSGDSSVSGGGGKLCGGGVLALDLRLDKD